MQIVDGFAQKTSWPKAKFRNIGRGKDRIRGIVIHTAENTEILRGAMNVAAWFTHPTARVSAHYAVDNTLIVRCIPEGDTAWHASDVNAATVGIELQGKASQNIADWDDDYSRAVLANAAALAADLCHRHGIPVHRVTGEELTARMADGRPLGIIGHGDVSAAYAHKKPHWDPGPAFPWAGFLAAVQARLDVLNGTG